ncbi:MAG: hypothetical protein R3E98_06200 [Gemmatimonadota bacterium]
MRPAPSGAPPPETWAERPVQEIVRDVPAALEVLDAAGVRLDRDGCRTLAELDRADLAEELRRLPRL